MDDLLKEAGVLKLEAAASMRLVHGELLEFRAALGDAEAAGELAAAAANPTAAVALRAQVSQLKVEWLQAGADAVTQAKIADQAIVLAGAHPESVVLTSAMVDWAAIAARPELADRLLETVTSKMNNRVVARAKQVQARLAADRKLLALEDKPFVLTGTTVDGKPFSTADLKGKVILVDFWATWCGPCKAALPEIKAAYQKYHADGLEIVGVSNDYSPEALKDFVQKQDMPWVQLYDNDAGSNQEWNPVTLNYGITAIPRMFIINRQGILVSVTAREKYITLVEEAIQQNP